MTAAARRPSTRRDPARPGVAGITADDARAVAEGRMTIADLAGRVGVARQVASRRVARLRAAEGIEPPPTPEATPAPSGGPPVPIGERIEVDAVEVATSALLAAIVAGHREIAGPISPGGLRHAVGAVRDALAGLRELGVLAPVDAPAGELVVRQLTTDEEGALRAAANVPIGSDVE